MEEMELLLAEARSLANDMLTDVERAGGAASSSEAREAVQELVRSGEEMRDRLEEALDLAPSDSVQVRIDDALVHLEDALDVAHLALATGGVAANLEEMRIKIEEALAHLAETGDAELE